MKALALLLIGFASFSTAHATSANGFLHLSIKEGKLKKINYHHYQLDVGEVLTKSNLLKVEVINGESYLEYRAESKDKTLTLIDAVGFGKSSFSLSLNSITEMTHADFFYKDYKWQLYGPSVDALYDVLAELDRVDDRNQIQKMLSRENDATYSIGTGAGSIACYIDRGGNGQPPRVPTKACLFAEL